METDNPNENGWYNWEIITGRLAVREIRGLQTD